METQNKQFRNIEGQFSHMMRCITRYTKDNPCHVWVTMQFMREKDPLLIQIKMHRIGSDFDVVRTVRAIELPTISVTEMLDEMLQKANMKERGNKDEKN